MKEFEDAMIEVSPRAVLSEIADAIPRQCKENIIVIGSLAVGYHFFGEDDSITMRTKDADCLLSPRIQAIDAGLAITEQLYEANWRFRPDDRWLKPGDEKTPDENLPAVRLNPPGQTEWFIELLTVPESPQDRGMRWIRLKTSYGHFGLCSFGFLSLTNYEPYLTELGIYIARPEMMALANMLEHPEIKPKTMSGLIAGLPIKRSNKDLGRVLAIARLSEEKAEDAMLGWPDIWKKALQKRFPDDWRELAGRTGSGLRTILGNEPDLYEARHSCEYGLLSSNPPTLEELRLSGERLLKDAVEPLEKSL